ncbi:MAG: DUF1285 domain-containing protein [Minwuia sp.]|uniref:DUF1285 domain-containing protein n=1 Tax=Minwuia sp. TaxID=2493630 RepID=UPI003A86A74B
MSDKSYLDIERLAESIPDGSERSYPPVDKWDPERVGEIDIRIAQDGTWYHEGDPILRHELVKLFSTVLRRDDDGRHYLVTPAERLAIQVDVAPLFVNEMFRENAGPEQVIRFRTHTDDVAVLDDDHPLEVSVDAETGEPTPLVHIRGRLKGLLARSVFYDLVEIADEREIDGVEVQGVMSAGRFHVIGRSDGRPLNGNA